MLKTIRKKGNKVVAIFASLLLTLCLIPGTAFAAPDGTAEISVGAPIGGVPAEGYAPGDEFTVPVTIADNPGFCSFGFDFRFNGGLLVNANALELVSFDYAAPALLSETGWVVIANPGGAALGGMNLSFSDTTGNGQLFAATFKVLESAPAGEFTLGIGRLEDHPGNFSNTADQQVGVNFTSTKLTIKASAVDPAQVAVESPSTVVYPGDEFDVPVTIADNPGFMSAAFTLGFDDAVFELTALSAEDTPFEDYVLDSDLATASISYLGDYDLFEEITAEGTLFNATLKVKDGVTAATYPITIGLTGDHAANFVDVEGDPLAIEFTGSDVTVGIPTKVTVGNIAGTYRPGEEVTVPVAITDNPGFMAAAFTLGFDDAVFELTALSAAGTPFEDYVLDSDLATASISYLGNYDVALDLFEEITAEGTLFNATFKVKDGVAAATCPITVGLTGDYASNFVDNEGASLTIGFSGGSVKVGAALTGATLIIGEINGKPGDTIRVPVSIVNNSDGFASFALNILVNPSDALTLTGIETAGYLLAGKYVFPDHPDDYASHVLGVLSATDIVGDGQLLDLVFEIGDGVDGTGEGTPVTVGLGLRGDDSGNFNKVDPNDPNATVSVPVSFEPGTVTVVETLETPTADDLTYDTSDWTRTYTASSQTVSVTPKDGIGAVTVWYEGTNGTSYAKSQAGPTDVGEYAVVVDIASSPGYTAASGLGLGTLVINKATAPTITWPTVAALTYSETLTLANAVFNNDGSTNYGSFAWDDDSTSLAVPGGSYPVTFTPSASTIKNYEEIVTLTQNVAVTVNKAPARSISWPLAGSITYGQTLADSSLYDGTEGYGSFAWDDDTIKPEVPGGNYAVVFTPDSNYDADNYELPASLTQNVYVNVAKALAPSIDWPTAAPIQSGQQLSVSVLSGGSTEYGSFAWTDGTQTPSASGSFEVTFTPSASTIKNYEEIVTLTQNVAVTVFVSGDIDGNDRVNAADALLILRAATELITLTPAQELAADFNNDGYVTAADALALMRQVLGLPPRS